MQKLTSDVHFADERRAIGLMRSGGRTDGTGYVTQVIQYPVICAADIVEEMVTQGSRKPVTNDMHLVRCKDCRERLGFIA